MNKQLKPVFATTIMAFKILLLIVFQNKPLLLVRLTCYSLLVRWQVLLYLLVMQRRGFYRSHG
ncbi:hypothetical protein GCM10027347_07650 [Larkinella harenae]